MGQTFILFPNPLPRVLWGLSHYQKKTLIKLFPTVFFSEGFFFKTALDKDNWLNLKGNV